MGIRQFVARTDAALAMLEAARRKMAAAMADGDLDSTTWVDDITVDAAAGSVFVTVITKLETGTEFCNVIAIPIPDAEDVLFVFGIVKRFIGEMIAAAVIGPPAVKKDTPADA